MKEIRHASSSKMQPHSGFQHTLDLDTMQTAVLHVCKISSQFMSNEQQDMFIQIIVESSQMRVNICAFAMISPHLIDHKPMESLNEQFNE